MKNWLALIALFLSLSQSSWAEKTWTIGRASRITLVTNDSFFSKGPKSYQQQFSKFLASAKEDILIQIESVSKVSLEDMQAEFPVDAAESGYQILSGPERFEVGEHQAILWELAHNDDDHYVTLYAYLPTEHISCSVTFIYPKPVDPSMKGRLKKILSGGGH